MNRFDRFLFDTCNPNIVPVLRIGYALCILMHALVLLPDASYWFSDAGVLQTETARSLAGTSKWSLFFLLPNTPTIAYLSITSVCIHCVLLALGIFSRFQVAILFVWLVSYQNRMPLIHDGEDTVMRLFAFLLFFLPLDSKFSLLQRWRSTNAQPIRRDQAWALRLIQFEMTAIYASTCISKLAGETWQNGTALWYVSRMNDNYGRLIPSDLFDSLAVSQAATYGALAIEAFLPIGLWIPKLRWVAIGLGITLHLGIEFSMNLFLFEWVMILGLLSFVPPKAGDLQATQVTNEPPNAVPILLQR